MYGGSIGHLLILLFLLTRGWSAESSFSMFNNIPADCTDDILSITMRCRRSVNRNVAIPKNGEGSHEQCCSLSQRQVNQTAIPDTCNDTFSNAASNDAASIRACTTYELRTCQGDDVHFECDVNRKGRFLVTWRNPSGGLLTRNAAMVVADVQRNDAGTYTCEVAYAEGKILYSKKVHLIVQFSPVIVVPKLSRNEKGANLQCTAEAVPAAEVVWYKDDVLVIGSTQYSTTSETSNCITESFLHFHNYTSNFLNFSTQHNVLFYGNYTCTAINGYGHDSRVFAFYGFEWELLRATVAEEGRRPFNVTGFIIGMLPPLFISFYIILKLGYRSRYAEERGEDDGFREEPFFVGY